MTNRDDRLHQGSRLLLWMFCVLSAGCSQEPKNHEVLKREELEKDPVRAVVYGGNMTNWYNVLPIYDRSCAIGIDILGMASQSVKLILSRNLSVELTKKECLEGTCGHKRGFGLAPYSCIENSMLGNEAELLRRIYACSNSIGATLITADLFAMISETNVMDWFYWSLPEPYRQRRNGQEVGNIDTLFCRITYKGLPKTRKGCFVSYRLEDMRFVGSESQRHEMFEFLRRVANTERGDIAEVLVERGWTNGLHPHVIDIAHKLLETNRKYRTDQGGQWLH